MTIAIVKSILESIINDYLSLIDPDTTLTQEQLNELTDNLADGITNTVNPNGPCYPSTPR